MKFSRKLVGMVAVLASVSMLFVSCGGKKVEKGYSVTSADGSYVLSIAESGKAQLQDKSGSKLASVAIEIDEDWGRPIISVGDDAEQAEVREEATQFRVMVIEEGAEYDGALFTLNKYKLATQCKFSNPTNLYHWVPDAENNSDYLKFSETSIYHGANFYFMADGTLVVDAAGKIGSADKITWTYDTKTGLKINVPSDETEFGTLSVVTNTEGAYITYNLEYKDAVDLCGPYSKNGRMKIDETDFISNAVMNAVLAGN